MPLLTLPSFVSLYLVLSYLVTLFDFLSLDSIYFLPAENEFFSREKGIVYRNGEVYRDVIDTVSGKCIDRQLIRTNHARVMY